MRREPFHTLRRAPAALAIAASLLAVGGCAPRAAPCGADAELAELRRHERALHAEIAALRKQIERLERLPPANAAPVPPPGGPAAIAALIEAYRAALEAEDWTRLRREIYGGRVPARDRRYLELLFQRTQALRIELEPQALDTEGERARAIVRQKMSYTLARTGERRAAVIDVEMAFRRGEGGWRLAGVTVWR